jgi:1-phosphofructokinase family hexose kinase
MIHTLGLSPSLDVVYAVEAITAGAIHRPRTVLRLAGGKSLNVSRALARLGHRVRAIAPLGGALGDLVADLLRAEPCHTPRRAPVGGATSSVSLVRLATGAPTRMCVSAADDQAQTLTEFYEPTAADGSELDQLEEALAAVRVGEWLTLSGSVPAGIDPARLTGLLAGCSARGVRLALDTYGPILGRLLDQAAPAVVKINRAEAAELAGVDPEGVVELGAALRRRGAEVLVITDGTAGAVGWAADGAWRVRTDHPPGRYPVGSGDCFLAGLVAGLTTGHSVPEALRTAAAVGAANAETLGGAVFASATVTALHRRTRVLVLTPAR